MSGLSAEVEHIAHEISKVQQESRAKSIETKSITKKQKEENAKENREILINLFDKYFEDDFEDGISGYGDENVLHEDESGFDSCEDVIDCDDYPCDLEYCDWRHGKIGRNKRSKTNSRRNSEKFHGGHLNSCVKNGEKSISVSGQNKKLKSCRVQFLKKDARKAANKKIFIEFKKNNVEERLKVKKTPRRGPIVTSHVGTDQYQPSPSEYLVIRNHKGHYDGNQFILREDNADKLGNEAILANFIQLQDREITPEDFDLLLHLDTFVEVKTVPKAVIDSLKTENLDKKMDNPCMICMEECVVGDVIKYLKCCHFFHSTCIRSWLTLSSSNCPIDGQEMY